MQLALLLEAFFPTALCRVVEDYAKQFEGKRLVTLSLDFCCALTENTFLCGKNWPLGAEGDHEVVSVSSGAKQTLWSVDLKAGRPFFAVSPDVVFVHLPHLSHANANSPDFCTLVRVRTGETIAEFPRPILESGAFVQDENGLNRYAVFTTDGHSLFVVDVIQHTQTQFEVKGNNPVFRYFDRCVALPPCKVAIWYERGKCICIVDVRSKEVVGWIMLPRNSTWIAEVCFDAVRELVFVAHTNATISYWQLGNLAKRHQINLWWQEGQVVADTRRVNRNNEANCRLWENCLDVLHEGRLIALVFHERNSKHMFLVTIDLATEKTEQVKVPFHCDSVQVLPDDKVVVSGFVRNLHLHTSDLFE